MPLMGFLHFYEAYLETEGGAAMEILISLIITVMAGVISHFICKWLDNDKK